MAVATLKESVITGTVRRFELPDLYQHGGWIKTRLLTKFPHLNEVSIIGWLKSALYDHSSLFLYQEHSVALAQTLKLHTLEPAPVVHERFVWCKDPKDPDHQAEAAVFYERFLAWAKHQSCSAMIIEEASDVPHELIIKKLGDKRIMNRQQAFVRL